MSLIVAETPLATRCSPGVKWQRVRLEEIVSHFPGAWGAEKATANSREVTVLGVGNVTNIGGLHLNGAERRHLAPSETTAIAEERDLLVVKSSGSAANIRSGKTAICPPELSGKIACSNFMFRLRVHREAADPYLLWLLLNSPAAKEFVRKIAGASTYPNIKWETYRQFSLSLPPLAEQQRIAARLREQLAAAETARQAVAAQLAAARRLPSAILESTFAGSEADAWPRPKVGEVAQVVGGFQKTPDRSPRNFHRPFLTVRNVQHGCLDLSNVERFEITPAELERNRLEHGDLLIVEGNGSLAHIGRSAVFKEDGEWIHQNHIIRARFRPDILDPMFVSHYFASPPGRSRMVEKAMTTTGLHTLSTSKIAAMEVPMPPLAEQRTIAARLDAELAATAALRASLERRLHDLEKLPAALLREAFGGNES